LEQYVTVSRFVCHLHYLFSCAISWVARKNLVEQYVTVS
jgi:hypothetical protein